MRAGEFGERLRTGHTYAKVQLAGAHIPFAVFNVGTGTGMKFVDCARRVTEKAGSPLEMVPWPADRKAIETGDFVSDGTAAKEALGWSPSTSFEDGRSKKPLLFIARISNIISE